MDRSVQGIPIKKKKKECARYDMYSSSHLCPYYNLELGESFKAKLDKSN